MSTQAAACPGCGAPIPVELAPLQPVSKDAVICENCNHIGKSKTATKGSLLIEIFAWVCFILPGICYSLWRLTTKHKACRKCGNDRLVPANSVRGQQLRRAASAGG